MACAGRYLASVLGVFTVCNLPFVIWGPRAWADGVLIPFTKPLVADGQGLVTLAIHGLTGGVVLPLLTLAGALVYVALLAAFVVWYPAMKVVWLFVLPVVLLVPGRSFSGYLIDFFPAALVAAVTVAHVPRTARVDVGSRPGGGLPARPSACRSSPRRRSVRWPSPRLPSTLSVVTVRTSQATQRLDAVTVMVHNLTGHSSLRTSWWSSTARIPRDSGKRRAARRPLVLGAGATGTVTLRPNEFTWSPTHGSHWLVEAYTRSPDAAQHVGAPGVAPRAPAVSRAQAGANGPRAPRARTGGLS